MLLALLLGSLIQTSWAAAQETELVLKEGAGLSAKTASGTISIIAGKDFIRSYEWDGCSLPANMGARDSRWFGSLGIYDPAGRYSESDSDFPSCKGISRTVVQEGQIHFADVTEAERWVRRYSKYSDTVWSKDGLVVQWGLNSAREQINVDVWQVCISGKRPKALAGAKDRSLTLKPDRGAYRYACASVESAVYDETSKAWQDWWNIQDERMKGHQ